MQHELHLLAYFYPRPPRGGRREPESRFCCCRKFLSTPSARRATLSESHRRYAKSISIHALREEGDHDLIFFNVQIIISIHALREEGDELTAHLHSLQMISIHALREEGD